MGAGTIYNTAKRKALRKELADRKRFDYEQAERERLADLPTIMPFAPTPGYAPLPDYHSSVDRAKEVLGDELRAPDNFRDARYRRQQIRDAMNAPTGGSGISQALRQYLDTPRVQPTQNLANYQPFARPVTNQLRGSGYVNFDPFGDKGGPTNGNVSTV